MELNSSHRKLVDAYVKEMFNTIEEINAKGERYMFNKFIRTRGAQLIKDQLPIDLAEDVKNKLISIAYHSGVPGYWTIPVVYMYYFHLKFYKRWDEEKICFMQNTAKPIFKEYKISKDEKEMLFKKYFPKTNERSTLDDRCQRDRLAGELFIKDFNRFTGLFGSEYKPDSATKSTIIHQYSAETMKPYFDEANRIINDKCTWIVQYATRIEIEIPAHSRAVSITNALQTKSSTQKLFFPNDIIAELGMNLQSGSSSTDESVSEINDVMDYAVMDDSDHAEQFQEKQDFKDSDEDYEITQSGRSYFARVLLEPTAPDCFMISPIPSIFHHDTQTKIATEARKFTFKLKENVSVPDPGNVTSKVQNQAIQKRSDFTMGYTTTHKPTTSKRVAQIAKPKNSTFIPPRTTIDDDDDDLIPPKIRKWQY